MTGGLKSSASLTISGVLRLVQHRQARGGSGISWNQCQRRIEWPDQS
jgi:hypothetical protein